MSTFQILSATEKKRFTGSKGGEFIVWNVEFDGNDARGNAELVKAATSPTPSGSIDATLEQTQYGPKLKETRKDGFGGGQRGKSPQERAEIRRLASHKVAVETLSLQVRLAVANGDTEKFKGKTPQELLGNLIAFFDDDAREAGERA